MSLFAHELDLPRRGRSGRCTGRPDLMPGDSHVLIDQEGPGCIRHWWLTYRRPTAEHDDIHGLWLEVFYDGAETPAIAMTLAQFFGVLLEQRCFGLHSGALRVNPANALNCDLPMPFRQVRMCVSNRSQRKLAIWYMVDYQMYTADTTLCDERLVAQHRDEDPAPAAGSMRLFEASGRGFIAGLVKGIAVEDRSDSWYHNGGDLWLIDGEHDPHALRGIGGEDLFGMSFGIYDHQDQWVGAPLLVETGEQDSRGGTRHAGIMYRFFGPDPVHFERSLILRFGTKANRTAATVYAYLAASEQEPVPGVERWELAGPFPCAGQEDFDRREWPEDPRASWPSEYTVEFGQYATPARARSGQQPGVCFAVPQLQASERGWCDLARHFRGIGGGNVGTQAKQVSAYARGELQVPAPGDYRLVCCFDDRIRIWLDGEECFATHHEQGCAAAAIPCPAGRHEVLVKLSNEDNREWRLWAFHMALRRV